MKRKKHNNVLDIPRTSVLALYLACHMDEKKTIEKYDDELKEREIFLYEKFGFKRPDAGIDSSTRGLIREMAKKLDIPGFYQMNETNKVGRPRSWKGNKGFVLWARVRIKMLEKQTNNLRYGINLVMNEYESEYGKRLDDIYKRYNQEILTENNLVKYWSSILEKLLNSDIVKNYNDKHGINMSKRDHELKIMKILLNSYVERNNFDTTSLYKM